MVEINADRCIGCGRCAADCLPQALEIREGKAHFLADHNCMLCGHCIAVCPASAVSIPSLNMREVVPLSELPHALNAEDFLGHIRARRSIRHFASTPLTEEELEMILETGRFSPTGGNRQDVRYNVLQGRLPQFRRLVLEELEKLWQEDSGSSWYPGLWHQMYLDFVENGKDRLFFDAPTVFVVSSDSPQAACIASAHMETMANALGLGVLYSGFTVRALLHSEKLRGFLEMKDGWQPWTVLAAGRPRITYYRTVPRKQADVVWM